MPPLVFLVRARLAAAVAGRECHEGWNGEGGCNGRGGIWVVGLIRNGRRKKFGFNGFRGVKETGW